MELQNKKKKQKNTIENTRLVKCMTEGMHATQSICLLLGLYGW